MNEYFVDLHIHIGRTIYGDPVKITASDQLTLSHIVEHAAYQKGLHMIGVIDSHVPAVQDEIMRLINEGKAYELDEGGVRYGPLTLILGCEVEVYDQNCKGPIHVLCYLPSLETMQQFTVWLSERVTNSTLSSQRMYGKATELQTKVKELGGLFVPAHVFTPFKSLYGKGVKQSLTEVLNEEQIDAIELGLSADTSMAQQIAELDAYPFVTNSDAHSLPKIGREYQKISLYENSFSELRLAFREGAGRRILKNFGMNPLLGKYYSTVCAECLQSASECSCSRSVIVKGVADRIQELITNSPVTRDRPPYIHQVPLEYLPKLGPKTLSKLIDEFGTEMNVLHHVSEQDLKRVVPDQIAKLIIDNRHGNLSLNAGGGGSYGKVKEPPA